MTTSTFFETWGYFSIFLAFVLSPTFKKELADLTAVFAGDEAFTTVFNEGSISTFLACFFGNWSFFTGAEAATGAAGAAVVFLTTVGSDDDLTSSSYTTFSLT